LNRDDHPGVSSFTEPFKTKYKETISRLEDELSTLGDQCQKIEGLEDKLTEFDLLKTDISDLKQSISALQEITENFQQNKNRNSPDLLQRYFF
jgi:DNA repair exonuclease SbcCD ATPase subunit